MNGIACDLPEVDAEVERARLKLKWHVYDSAQLARRIATLNSGGFLIDGLFPNRSLSIVVGDSGLGKSPLLYQASICVAHGIPFLGFPVTKARVLYMDYENGLQGVAALTGRLAKHLGLELIDHNQFFSWNFNDAPSIWSSSKLEEMVGDLRPDWVTIDPLSGFDPSIETNPENVTRTFQKLRAIAQKFGSGFTGVHHVKKPSDKLQFSNPELMDNAKAWMLQARGTRQLINGADVRLGIDAVKGGTTHGNLVVAGFERLRGDIGPLLVERVFDEDGDPLGYRKMSGASLLCNPQQEKAFQELPEIFKFKQARQVYGRSDQPTADFLKKCQAAGILRHEGNMYCKVEGP